MFPGDSGLSCMFPGDSGLFMGPPWGQCPIPSGGEPLSCGSRLRAVPFYELPAGVSASSSPALGSAALGSVPLCCFRRDPTRGRSTRGQCILIDPAWGEGCQPGFSALSPSSAIPSRGQCLVIDPGWGECPFDGFAVRHGVSAFCLRSEASYAIAPQASSTGSNIRMHRLRGRVRIRP